MPRRDPTSAYREALENIGGVGAQITTLTPEQQDELYEYLRRHRTEDVTLCLGYHLMRAERDFNLNQSGVAERAGVSRSFISSILSGRSLATPQSFTAIARALNANPIEFMLAAGLIDKSDLVAYQLPDAAGWQPIAQMLTNVPSEERRNAISVVGAVLRTLLARLDSAPSSGRRKRQGAEEAVEA